MKKMILLVVMLTLVAFVSGVMAQPPKKEPAPAKPAVTPAPAKPAVTPAPPEKPKLEKFSGMIDKIDEKAKTIDVKGKVRKEEKILTFVIDDKTEIIKGKEKLTFADLKKGMNVSVKYIKEADKLIARKITIAVPKAPPKAAPKKEEPKK